MDNSRRVSDEAESNKLDRLIGAFSAPGPHEEDFFRRRRREDKGIGLDAEGKLTRQNPER